MKKLAILLFPVIFMLSCLNGCFIGYIPNDVKQRVDVAETTTEPPIETTSPIVINWEASLNTPEVADDIKNAFREIGEKPEYIVSVEHVKDIETSLFIRREYKVCFDKGDLITLFDGDERKWNHAIEWRITTEEWYEGEPEREQYPREYLVTIKFWTDDDSTNILQWSHTGNGKLQEE